MTHAYDFEVLFLLPFAVAIGFLVWVFWNLTREVRPRPSSFRFDEGKFRNSNSEFGAGRN